jgi:hypothetical protein
LIAGLSIISIVGGNQNVEQLVKALLGVKLDALQIVSDSTSSNWQIQNQIKGTCDSAISHGPLTPVSAAKAIRLNIWRQREEEIVLSIGPETRQTGGKC